MSIRLISCGALIVGAALLGTGCRNPAQAQVTPSPQQEQTQGGSFCGGIAAIQCPEGFTCVDDPSDTCDPNNGGADCGGICEKEKKPNCDDPNRTYVSKDPDKCAAIRFVCETGKEPFFDDCGCGCQPVP
ncbi:hypothetical protein JQX13_44460 [Archangium violaceum]|uniref:hypothetical protein n=1 Tax=Archangium violaceum TaxID=83451 RepID=UPI00193C3C0C|nr:hypothetical protein [Archangium violaceum]QRK07038.1 hypothetical protein JQX13_44460 [Archangium violaceum]